MHSVTGLWTVCGLESDVIYNAYIAVGSNLGDRRATIDQAIETIRARRDISLVQVSSMIETDPVGDIEQGRYLNGMIHIQTRMDARELLEHMMRVEQSLGRDRSVEQRWGPRTIDLDLIVFGDQIIDEPGLQVPHPRLHERSFVLAPLCEIAADIVVLVHNQTPRQMLEALGGV